MMKKIENSTELNDRIKLLEAKILLRENSLKISAVDLYQSLQPMNILKNKIDELTNSNISENKFLKTGLGLGAGFLLDKVLLGGKRNFAKNISSYLLTFLSTKLITENADGLLDKIDSFIKIIREKRNEKPVDSESIS